MMVIKFPREKYNILDRREDMLTELFTIFVSGCDQFGLNSGTEEFIENASEVFTAMGYLIDSELGLNIESTSEKSQH